MKTKTFDKKLQLNKKTIAHLEKDELEKVYGGIWKSMQITACCSNSCPIPC